MTHCREGECLSRCSCSNWVHALLGQPPLARVYSIGQIVYCAYAVRVSMCVCLCVQVGDD